jgi:hypothetical protein
MKFQLFCWSTLLSDTVHVLMATPKKEQPAVPRSTRRKVQQHVHRMKPISGSLFLCAASWFIGMEAVCPSRDVYLGACPLHQFEEVHQGLIGTSRRITYLDEGLDLTPGTFSEW